MNNYTNAYKKEGFIFKRRPSYISMPNRRIITNIPDKQVCDNSIQTSKYSFWNFIPLNLIVQFSKVPNVYFLIIGIMQMISSISVSGGFPVIFIPLSIVVSVSAVKDFYQDLKRKRSDQEINNQKAHVLSESGWKETFWKEIRIGDVIKINVNEQAPADIILLQSSDEKNSCFVETKNLDGETNLKYKRVNQQIWKDFGRIESSELYEKRKQFSYEKPNPYIHTFTGSYNGVPIDNNNVILRGCMVKITNWVTGLVIYSGYDSKIMLNGNRSRSKKSRLEFKMGIIVASIFGIQMLITFISAIISTVSVTNQYFTAESFINFGSQLFIKWGRWILLFTNFVPISLIVSLQMVKYIQGLNITASKFISNRESGGESKEPSVVVQTSSLNQQLGQIQHLFTDKTGTLTCNYMSFKYMVIGSKVFGYGEPAGIPESITNVDFHDRQFMKKVALGQNFFQKEISQQENFETFHMLIALTLCHNVIIQDNENGDKKYNASSPDELAFINMAKYCGFSYTGVNSQNQMCYTNKGEQFRFKLLHLIQFDSDRKRMSVIIQRGQRVLLYCKGADNIIIQRLQEKQKNLNSTKEHLHNWSVNGFRTLLFGFRQIPLNSYLKWAKMYAYSLSRLEECEQDSKIKLKKTISKEEQKQIRDSRISGSQKKKIEFNIENISKLIIDYSMIKGSEQENQHSHHAQDILNQLINGVNSTCLTEYQKRFLQRHLENLEESTGYTSKNLQDMLEKQLTLIGATAIEDRLQDNVKKTISSIRAAGVKIWMLTGDKRQTAINIGVSCGLVSQDMAIVYWKQNAVQTQLERQKIKEGRLVCIVVTGQDLLGTSSDPGSQAVLLRLLNSCNAIICCRVTPKQKQDMVWLMRKNRFTTLSIGDGANDVNMINTAHVGVGIKGVEGAQAAICSDYAISQFQLLGELMLYHGRQSYRKNSQLILFNFYKNLILVLPLFWYGMSNHFSASNIYDPWVYQLYNVVFTSIPIVLFAIFDQEYTSEFSIKNPKQYSLGLHNTLFNVPYIVKWFISPVIYSFFLCFFTFMIMNGNISSKGYFYDITSAGMSIFAQCVLLCNLKIALLAYKYSWILIISILFGIASFYGSCELANYFFGDKGELVNILEYQLDSGTYWMAVFSGVGLIMLFQLGMVRWRSLQKIQSANIKQQERCEKNQQEIEIEMPIMKFDKGQQN